MTVWEALAGVPAPLQEALFGGRFPAETDTDAMYRMADAWHQTAAELTGLAGVVRSVGVEALGAISGSTSSGIVGTATEYCDELDAHGEFCRAQGERLRQAAADIDKTRWEMVVSALMTVYQLQLLAPSGFVAWGIPLIAKARQKFFLMLEGLVSRLAQNSAAAGALRVGVLTVTATAGFAGFQAALDASIQGVQIVAGDRDRLDGTSIALAAAQAGGSVLGGMTFGQLIGVALSSRSGIPFQRALTGAAGGLGGLLAGAAAAMPITGSFELTWAGALSSFALGMAGTHTADHADTPGYDSRSMLSVLRPLHELMVTSPSTDSALRMHLSGLELLRFGDCRIMIRKATWRQTQIVDEHTGMDLYRKDIYFDADVIDRHGAQLGEISQSFQHDREGRIIAFYDSQKLTDTARGRRFEEPYIAALEHYAFTAGAYRLQVTAWPGGALDFSRKRYVWSGHDWEAILTGQQFVWAFDQLAPQLTSSDRELLRAKLAEFEPARYQQPLVGPSPADIATLKGDDRRLGEHLLSKMRSLTLVKYAPVHLEPSSPPSNTEVPLEPRFQRSRSPIDAVVDTRDLIPGVDDLKPGGGASTDTGAAGAAVEQRPYDPNASAPDLRTLTPLPELLSVPLPENERLGRELGGMTGRYGSVAFSLTDARYITKPDPNGILQNGRISGIEIKGSLAGSAGGLRCKPNIRIEFDGKGRISAKINLTGDDSPDMVSEVYQSFVKTWINDYYAPRADNVAIPGFRVDRAVLELSGGYTELLTRPDIRWQRDPIHVYEVAVDRLHHAAAEILNDLGRTERRVVLDALALFYGPISEHPSPAYLRGLRSNGHDLGKLLFEKSDWLVISHDGGDVVRDDVASNSAGKFTTQQQSDSDSSPRRFDMSAPDDIGESNEDSILRRLLSTDDPYDSELAEMLPKGGRANGIGFDLNPRYAATWEMKFDEEAALPSGFAVKIKEILLWGDIYGPTHKDLGHLEHSIKFDAQGNIFVDDTSYISEDAPGDALYEVVQTSLFEFYRLNGVDRIENCTTTGYGSAVARSGAKWSADPGRLNESIESVRSRARFIALDLTLAEQQLLNENIDRFDGPIESFPTPRELADLAVFDQDGRGRAPTLGERLMSGVTWNGVTVLRGSGVTH
ncbi:hypothetical protein ACFYO1_02240 [Nocardia sp. NPDC006044]|uniref:hypothetical protein n=1 Tax=Nocardia sp. NPDC006044 TaxID=3364306 RepID=UPI0036C41A45